MTKEIDDIKTWTLELCVEKKLGFIWDKMTNTKQNLDLLGMNIYSWNWMTTEKISGRAYDKESCQTQQWS